MPDAPARLARLLERTARLHRLTARMSSALTAAEVAQVAVDDSTEALGANSVALWRAEGDHLELVRANNYPTATLAYVQSIAIDAQSPVAEAFRTGMAVWLSSRAEYEERYVGAAARSRPVAPEAYSVAGLPIVVHGEVLGVIVVTFLIERTFDEDERSYLSFLALHCAQGFERVRLYERELQARYLAEAAQGRAVFLARASGLLGSSLDYEATLRNVALLAVPEIGDWCGIELLDEDGEAKQVAVAHVDPAKIELAHELRRRYPPARDARTGVPNVLRTGTSELFREITDEMLVAGSRDADHLRFARELGLSSVLIVPIKDRGAVLGAISFVLANTSRRYVDDDLRMAEQLAERAGAAISNAKLYAAAQTAIRMRDEFMLIAGHELRTPLSALSLHGEALERVRDAWPVEKLRERGMKLRIQTERIRRLVEDLLDVSRISAGRLSLELEELDFGAHVAEIIERMRDDFERARSPITLSAEPVRGRWDRSRTDQIITNLLANAAKYGRGTPIDVRVTSAPGKVDLAVTDRGIGIAPEDQPRIFKRFERAVSSRNFGGLGLGLWITSQLVEAHGGTIAVSSAPGAGATFTVSLPVA